MKSLFRNIILLGLPLVVFNTCELETNWDINLSENVMVVDAIITHENKTQEIRIYYSYPNLNDTSTAVSGANGVLFGLSHGDCCMFGSRNTG